MTIATSAGAFGRATYEIARKEVIQHVRTKRLLIIAPIFLFALVMVTIVVPLSFFTQEQMAGLQRESQTGLQNLVMLFFLSGVFIFSGYFYVQLIPILLTADAVCAEWSNKTIFLLLSKPVARSAFVLGKFLGSAATVAGLIVSLLLVDYLILQIIIPGHSSPEDWLRFAGALGILVLGAMAFASLSLLMGTLTKSAITANLVTVVLWIIVLPLLSNLDTIIWAFAQHGGAALGSDPPTWAKYLSPGSCMGVASDVLSPVTGTLRGLLGFIGGFFGFGSTLNAMGAVAALVVQTGIFLVLSLWVVNRRNFE